MFTEERTFSIATTGLKRAKFTNWWKYSKEGPWVLLIVVVVGVHRLHCADKHTDLVTCTTEESLLIKRHLS
jgi:hypothetical protein